VTNVEGRAVDVWTTAFRAFDFVCPPGDDAWRTEHSTGDAWVFAFPHRQVAIRSRGGRDIVADRSLVMVYPPGQEYGRRLIDPQGDRCDVIGVDADHMAVLSGDRHYDLAGSVRWLPVDPMTLLRQRVLFRRLGATSLARAGLDRLGVAEEVALILRAVLTGPTLPPSAARRPATQLHHRELVESARHHLGHDLGSDLDLVDLARTIGAAPHHLARVFRAGTGSSLHSYRIQLRLRAALDAILDGAAVGETAHALGFSSHAHMTSTFRSAFGRAPTSLLERQDA
jgi:AraC family transcriptional regulator